MHSGIKQFVRHACLAAMLLGYAPVSMAQENIDDRVEALIDQLAESDFSSRQSATAQLRRIGAGSLPQLSLAARSGEPEIRLRASRLLLEIRREAFDANLQAFVRNQTSRAEFQLPKGWSEFAGMVGDTYSARRMYAEMCRAEPRLLSEAFKGKTESSDELANLLQHRAGRLGRTRTASGENRQASVAERRRIASSHAILFVAAQQPDLLSDRAEQLVTQIGRAEANRIEPFSPTRAQQSHRLLTAWVNRCASSDLYIVSQLLRLAGSAELRDSVPMVMAVADGSRKLQPPHNELRAAAVLLVGKLGTERDISRLAPLLTDRAVCYAQRKGSKQPGRPDVQIRDVALAASLHLAGKNPREHGFDQAQTHPQKLYRISSLAFESGKSREASLAAWSKASSTGSSEGILIAEQPGERLTR